MTVCVRALAPQPAAQPAVLLTHSPPAAAAADDGNTAADCKQLYQPSAAADWATAWQQVLFELIAALPAGVTSQVQAVAFDGTSSTALLVDGATGRVLCAPKLYDEAQGPEAVAAAKVRSAGIGWWTAGMRQPPELTPAVNAQRAAEADACWAHLYVSVCVQAIAPASHTATASTSTLCKVLTWHLAHAWQDVAAAGGQPRLMHQADWLAYLLHGVCQPWNACSACHCATPHTAAAAAAGPQCLPRDVGALSAWPCCFADAC